MKKTWLQFSRGFLIAGLAMAIIDELFLAASKQMLFKGVLLASGIDIGLGIVCGLVAFILHLAFNRFVAVLGVSSRGFLKTLLAGAMLLGPAIFIWLKLFGGPKAREIPGRMLICIALGSLCALGGGLIVTALPSWIQKNDMRRRGWLLAASVLFIVAVCVDAWVLVRLYPLFHFVLTTVAVFALGLGLTFGLRAPTRPRSFAVLTATTAGLLLAAVISLLAVSRTQNVRFVIGYVTPTASDAADILSLFKFKGNKGMSEVGEIESPKSAANALSLPGANVFLITVDAMRYDRLRATGSKRGPAPNIDRFSKKAVLFERAYTAVPHTSYAITSLLTGKYTLPLFDVPGAPPVQETWPEVMRRFRYDTAGFFTPAVFFIDRARFEPYLRTGLGFSYRKVEAAHTAKQRTATLLEYLKARQDKTLPVFSWIHYFEPHEPYDETCTRFGTDAEDRYDCEIWTVDEAIGDLLAVIDADYPNAVVIITSDHGEEFGDHGGRYHGTTLFDEQVRVPLLMRIPGVLARRVDAPVSLVDLMGTVLRIVDIPSPARIRSRDLTGVILDGEKHIDAFSEVHDEAMVVYDGYKEICNVKTDLCRLYDLTHDPAETRSVTEQEPKRSWEMRRRIAAWRASFAKYELRPVSTDKNAEKWPDAIKRALGGDVTVLDDLLAVVSTSKEGAIRRKAAELAFRTAEEMPKHVPSPTDELDVEVSAWINALLAKFGDPDAAAALVKAAGNLDPAGEAYRAVALVRAAGGDSGAYDSLITVALDDGATEEERIQALGYLGTMEKKTSVERLIPLINNYQLTLAAAKALGAVKLKAAVEPLTVRLKRERFLERKAAIIDALANIGDWRAVEPISDELYDETPPPNALLALSRLTDLSPFGRRLPSDKKGRETVFYRPVPKDPIKVFLKDIGRVVVRTSSEADGGSVWVTCGGVEAGSIPLNAGAAESVVDLSSCEKRPGKPFELSFRVESDMSRALVESVAILTK